MESKIANSGFDTFFINEYKKLVGFVQKNMEKRYADATPEDIVQDVALSLLDKFNVDAQIENLAGYFYRSLRNKITDSQKKKRNQISIDDYVAQNSENKLIGNLAFEPDEPKLNDYEPHQVRNAIDKLSSEDKYIVNGIHFDGKSFQQLSVELNTPIGTLLSRKHRALVKLGKLLETSK